MHRQSIYIIACGAALLMAACGGSRKAGQAETSPFAREPIHEVTEESLAVDARIIDAIALRESGRQKEALEAFVAITEDAPQCADAWYEAGRILTAIHWTDRAVEYLRHATGLQPENLWYLRALDEAYRAAQDGKGMVEVRKRLVELQPSQIGPYEDLAMAYAATADYKQAVATLNRVERMIGITEEVSMQKQRLLVLDGKEKQALHEMERLSDAMPQNKQYAAIMAEHYMSLNKYDKALGYYQRILDNNPNDEYIHIQLAEFYKRTGDTNRADAELLKAFDNPMLECRSKMQIISSFYTEKEFYGSRQQQVMELMNKVMATCNDSTAYAALFGEVMMRQERFAEATRWFAVALTTEDSMRYEVWEAMLISLSPQPERAEESVSYAEHAERLFPMKTLPLFIQALNMMQHEDYGGALAKLEKAKRWGFNKGYLEADTYGLLGECYYRLGRYDAAWTAFEKSISLNPKDWGTMNNYAYYLSEQRTNLGRAEELSRRTIDAEPDNANSLDTYAWILHLMGRDAEARTYMDRALRLNPGNETYQRHRKAME